jgi:hypothetical protein
MPDPTTTISTGKPDATEIGHVRFGKGSSKKDPNDGHLVGDLLHFTPGFVGAGGCDSRRPPIKDGLRTVSASSRLVRAEP